MKQTLLYVFLLFSDTIFSQNAVAELKFEEAETAFNNANYDLALEKVNEFEDVLGGMTDKSLYLRVISQSKLFSAGNFYVDEKQLTLYNSLIVNSNKYLKATENNGLNDKFKEVYAINENLKKLNLPKDKINYEKEIQKQKALAEKENQAQLVKEEECKKAFEELTIDGLPFGITIEEFQKQYPNVLGENPKKIMNPTWGLYYPKNNVSFNKYGTVLDKFEEAGQNITLITDSKNGGKITTYEKIIYFYNGKENKLSEFNSIKKDLLEKYKYLSDCSKTYNSDTTFEVKYNNKTFSIVSTQDSKIYKISIWVYKKI